jgi:hypothetical protein
MARSLSTARRGFKIWRRTRPFWGGLLVICGAGEILLSEQGPLSLVIHIGIQGLAGYLIPVMLLLCGVLLWFSPAQRPFYSLLAIVLALGSWVTSNLGGFFIGMLLSLVGAAAAFAWTIDPDEKPLKWFRGNPQVLQPSWGAELVLRPTATLPPVRRVLGSIETAGTPYWSAISPSEWAGPVVGTTGSHTNEFAITLPGSFGTDAAAAERDAYGRLTRQQGSGGRHAITGARPPPGTPPSPSAIADGGFRVHLSQKSISAGCISLRAASVRLPDNDG